MLTSPTSPNLQARGEVAPLDCRPGARVKEGVHCLSKIKLQIKAKFCIIDHKCSGHDKTCQLQKNPKQTRLGVTNTLTDNSCKAPHLKKHKAQMRQTGGGGRSPELTLFEGKWKMYIAISQGQTFHPLHNDVTRSFWDQIFHIRNCKCLGLDNDRNPPPKSRPV